MASGRRRRGFWDAKRGVYQIYQPRRPTRIGFLHLPRLWMMAASRVSSEAFRLAALIRHQHNLRRVPEIVLPPSLLREWNINRKSEARALYALEGAGLIRVQRHRGRRPVIAIIELVPDTILMDPLTGERLPDPLYPQQ